MALTILGGRKMGATLADPREAEDLAEAESRHDMELAAANGRAGRAEVAAEKARAALRDTAGEVAALVERSLPLLRSGMYADDPMPADGVSWDAVAGDRYELPVQIGLSDRVIAGEVPA